MADRLLVLNSFLTVPVRAKFAVAARELIDSIQPDTATAKQKNRRPRMIATRIASTVTAIAICAASMTAVQLASAPPAQAALGCCMIRADLRSEWLQGKQSFKQCKELNSDKDGDKDKLFKKTGLVWWNIRC